jgi:hypothetical protein
MVGSGSQSENLNGISQEKTQSENFQAQAPQAHEAESSQEASSLQGITRDCALLIRWP